MGLMYICSIFYQGVLLASMFTNLHNSEHLKYFIPMYSPLFQNKALNPSRVNPDLPSGLTRERLAFRNLFMFDGVSSSSRCLGKPTLFYLWAFHITFGKYVKMCVSVI